MGKKKAASKTPGAVKSAPRRCVVSPNIRHSEELQKIADAVLLENPNIAAAELARLISERIMPVRILLSIREQIDLFKATDNGVHMWEAYALARWPGQTIEIPKEVLEYFDSCSQAALNCREAREIAAGMKLTGVKGGKKGLRISSKQRRQQQVDLDYRHRRRLGQSAPQIRIELAAQYGHKTPEALETSIKEYRRDRKRKGL